MGDVSKCIKCHEVKALDDFYVCMTYGKPQRKTSCKICFNRYKHRNARERKRQELLTGKKLVKYSKLKTRKSSFSKDATAALREGDIVN